MICCSKCEAWVRVPGLCELCQLKAENERLTALVEERFKDAATAYLQSAGPDGKGGFRFDIRAGIIPLIVEHLAANFKALGGDNYVQMEVMHDELGPLVLTLQRKWGELPASVAAKYREALQSIAANTCCDKCQEAALVARAALAKAQPEDGRE